MKGGVCYATSIVLTLKLLEDCKRPESLQSQRHRHAHEKFQPIK